MKLCVIGLGKLGSVVAALYGAAGHEVIGVDTNEHLVALLAEGTAPFQEPGLQDLLHRTEGRLRATTDLATAIGESEAAILILPTPSLPDGSFSSAVLEAVLESIGRAIRHPEFLVVVASTVSPGTSQGSLRMALEKGLGRPLDGRAGLVYSPEFIALGSVVHDMRFPEMVLIGSSNPASAEKAEALFLSVIESNPFVAHMSLPSAEIAKLAVNTFVTTKISYANMIAELSDHVPGASAHDILNAVGHDSRIGTKYLKPAVGYGGPCFPRDNRALSASASKYGLAMPIAESTDAVNDRQPTRIVDQVKQLVAPPASVAVLGLAYKPDTPVCEESQGVKIANLLHNDGYRVSVHDPKALSVAANDLHSEIQLCPSTDEAVAGADCVVIVTPWAEYDSASLKSLTESSLTIDPWQLLKSPIEGIPA